MAIATLRQKIGITQLEFAKRLGVTLTTISRYENGREPARHALTKLASLAEANRIDYLRDIFVAKRRGGIISRVERLPSAGSARPVEVLDLEQWMKGLNDATAASKKFLTAVLKGPVTREFTEAFVRNNLVTIESVRDDMELYHPVRAAARRLPELETAFGKPPDSDTEVDLTPYKRSLNPRIDHGTYGPEGLKLYAAAKKSPRRRRPKSSA
jgi:transcriptional regulator with XRE-family HTH domain